MFDSFGSIADANDPCGRLCKTQDVSTREIVDELDGGLTDRPDGLDGEHLRIDRLCADQMNRRSTACLRGSSAPPPNIASRTVEVYGHRLIEHESRPRHP